MAALVENDEIAEAPHRHCEDSEEGSDSDSDSDGGVPTIDLEALAGELSADTLAALRGHIAEQATAGQAETDAQAALEAGGVQGGAAAGLPSEDFHLSQFWYDAPTAATLAAEMTAAAGPGGRVAILSCPSAMYPLVAAGGAAADGAVLLEYDGRFAHNFGAQFVQYDYRRPEQLPADLIGAFDAVLCDPPYVAEECVRGFASTAALLSRRRSVAAVGSELAGAEAPTNCVFITSAMLEETMQRLLGMTMTPYMLTFASKLRTPLRCYANYPANVLHKAAEEAAAKT